MATPRPDSVETLRRHWEQIKSERRRQMILTQGRPEAIRETEIWRLCAAMGLEPLDGAFGWMVERFPNPLVSVRSASGARFDLEAVANEATHAEILVSFEVACSPDPEASFRAWLSIARQFEKKLGCVTSTEGANSLEEAAGLLNMVQASAKALREVNLPPGSAEALALFAA